MNRNPDASRLITVILFFVIAVAISCDVSATADDVKGERHGLLVGVGHYDPDCFSNLPGAEPDVRELARVLTSNGFEHEHVVLMTHREGAIDPRRLPTASKIRKQLKRLTSGRGSNDSVVIALAGHGLQPNGNTYLFCPQDADPSNPETFVSIEEIFETLDDCDAGFKLLLMDACRETNSVVPAAEIGSTGIQSVTRVRARPWLSLPEPPTGTAVFFSCSPGQLAYERHDEHATHGVFFHAVIRGLDGAAAGNDGLVTLPDLERFVKKDVETFVRKTYSAPQHPVIRNNILELVPLVSYSHSHRRVADARKLWDRGRRDEARGIVKALLKKRPGDGIALAERSRMLSEQGERFDDKQAIEQAYELAEQAIAAAPHESASYLARANIFRIREQHEQVLINCQTAKLCDPNCVWAYIQSAAAHQQLHHHDAMLREIETAMDMDDTHPIARSLYGGILFSLERMDDGMKLIDDGIAMTPDVPILHFMKGYGLDQQGRYDKAILAYTAAIRLDDNDDELYCRRAVSLANAGDFPAANEDADAAERINPSNIGIVGARVVSLVHQRRHQEAIAMLGQALQTHPDAEDLLLARGGCYFALNQQHSALADFTRLTDVNPKNTDARVYVAVIRMKAGNFDEALRQLDLATDHNENHAVAHYTKAAIHVKKMDLAVALPHLQRAVELDPSNKEWVTQRDTILRRLGRSLPAQSGRATQRPPSHTQKYQTIIRTRQ